MTDEPLTIPPPLRDREGHIGGVESVAVDGKRWLFGFDHSLDLVVSPLIEDPAVMAVFASRHMLQTDGAHGREHWAEILRWAVEDVSGGLASHADSDYGP